jgi:hypothetical protein
MFDREDAAVRENANRHARAVLDRIEAEIGIARRLPTSCARGHHPASLSESSAAGPLLLRNLMRQIELRCAGHGVEDLRLAPSVLDASQ